jgi:lysophospholipid acyltransferase 5
MSSELKFVLKWKYETATSLNTIIAAFNINTNQWVKRYVFKRLIFLNNKNLSSLGSLIFLALWHGTHPGYFLVFFLEFIDVEAERRFRTMAGPAIQHFQSISSSAIRIFLINPFVTVGAYLWTSLSLYYASVAFDLLQFSKVKASWGSVYYIGHVLVVVICATDALLGRNIRKAFSPPKQTEKKSK